MNKETKNVMTGVVCAYFGIMMWILSLEGYENIDWMMVLDILKQMVLPFIFTELWVAIGVEGFRNLKKGFIEFRAKLKKKFEKKEEVKAEA